MKVRKKRGEPLMLISEVDALDVTTARELHGHLVDALAAERGVEIDAAAVERVDAAGLQVLWAAVRAAQAQGVAVRCANASPVLRDTAELLGLGGCLAAN